MTESARFAGHERGRDDNVGVRDRFAEQLLLLLVELLGLGFRIAPLSSRRRFRAATRQKRPPRLSTCSLTAGRVSYASTTAPSRRAVPIACKPATPAPRTNTRAGVTVPAAVIISGRTSAIGSQPKARPCSPRLNSWALKRVHRLPRVMRGINSIANTVMLAAMAIAAFANRAAKAEVRRLLFMRAISSSVGGWTLRTMSASERTAGLICADLS